MASNGAISFRAGRGPSFILVGLVLIVVILFYSYWGVSSKNSKLLKDASILQDRLRVLAARKITAEKKSSALITQITRLQDENGRELNMKDTKISQVMELMQNKGSELEALQEREKKHLSELEKLKGEINKTSGSFRLLKGKAGELIRKYEAMKANYSALQEKVAQLQAEKQQYHKQLEAYKVEYQKVRQAFAAKHLIQAIPEKPKEEDVNSYRKKIEDAQPTQIALRVTLPKSSVVAGNSLSISERKENAVVSEEEGKNKEEREIKALLTKDVKDVNPGVLTSAKGAEQNVSVASKSLVLSHESGSVSALETANAEKMRSEPEATKGESSEALTGNQEGVAKEELNNAGMLSERQQKAVNEVEDEQSDGGGHKSVNFPKPDEGERDDQEDTEGVNEDEQQEEEGQENEEDDERRDTEGDTLADFIHGRKMADEKDNIDDEKKTLLARNLREDSLKHEWFQNKDNQKQHPLKRPDLPESAIDQNRGDIDDEDDGDNFR